MLKINFRSNKDAEEKLAKNEKQAEDADENDDEKTFLMAQYFLLNSIEFINASFYNNKINENVMVFFHIEELKIVKYIFHFFLEVYCSTNQVFASSV